MSNISDQIRRETEDRVNLNAVRNVLMHTDCSLPEAESILGLDFKALEKYREELLKYEEIRNETRKAALDKERRAVISFIAENKSLPFQSAAKLITDLIAFWEEGDKKEYGEK